MRHLLALLLVAIFATSAFAEDTKAGKKGAFSKQVGKIKKMLEPLTLTAEQETSFAKALKTYQTKLAELEGKGLSKDKVKARGMKYKEGRESGIKGKKLQAFINEGMSEQEIEMIKELDMSTRKTEKTVAKMLTEDQLSSLPKKTQNRLMRLLKAGKDDMGKKKKSAQDE